VRWYGQQRETKGIPDPAQGLGQPSHCNKTPAFKDDTSLFSFLKTSNNILQKYCKLLHTKDLKAKVNGTER
jgi:hypothetical protein